MNRGDVWRCVDFDVDVWLEEDKCRRLDDKVVENPSDEDAARAKIIATSIEAGAWLIVAMLMVVSASDVAARWGAEFW